MTQLYARVFTQILDSSLAENWQARHVFEDLLKLADEGIVDMTRQAISRRTNVPLEIVNEAIAVLESSDKDSRDAADEGRRLVRLDVHREWGWRIVNWEKYEAVKSRLDEKAKTRERVRRHREKSQQATPFPTPLTQRTDSDSDSEEALPKRYKPLHTVTEEAIYQAYPRKVGKPEALRAISKALRNVSGEKLLELTKAFAEVRSGDLAFCPNPATWFNQERYNDDPATWRPDSPKTSTKNEHRNRNTGTLNDPNDYAGIK